MFVLENVFILLTNLNMEHSKTEAMGHGRLGVD